MSAVMRWRIPHRGDRDAQTLAVHFEHDAIRLVELRGGPACVVGCALELPLDDPEALREAAARCVATEASVALPASAAVMTHLRLAPDTGDDAVPGMLLGHDDAWANAEFRMATVATIDGATGPQRELLCVGIDRTHVMDAVQRLQDAGLSTRTVTTSLFAAMQGFERLHRREDDELHTTLHVHIEACAVVAAMTHGSRCVLSRALRSPGPDGTQQWQDDGSDATEECNMDEIERRQEQSPRSLHALSPVEEASFAPLAEELRSCVLHHDAVHPDRSVDRLVFTGTGACDRTACGTIASHVGIPAFLGDPSKWLGENRLAVAGPAWAAAAGLCLRPMRDAA